MKIFTRSFVIPESPEEVALCMASKGLHMLSVSCKDRSYSVWTEEENDDALMHDFLAKLDHEYYFKKVVLDEEDDPEHIANLINKANPEMVIDTRADLTGFNFDPVKAKIDGHGIRFRWIPKLSQNDFFQDGVFEAKQLLKSYRRFIFIGERKHRLDKIVKLLQNETKETFE